jgi:hypothetical protein
MDEHPKWTTEQLEILETLRSGDAVDVDPALASTSEALKQDPSLAERLERTLDWDARVSEAIQDVPTPQGLAEQILDRLDASLDQPSPAPEPRRSRSRRRRWVALATGAGLVAVLLIVGVLGQSLPEMSGDELRSIARDRFVGNQEDPPPRGSLLSQVAPPARFPISPDLRDMPGTRWNDDVLDFNHAKALAYDIPLRPAQKATLYVVRCRSQSLPQRPPSPPQFRTLGLVIAAWQADGLAYVLVVEGSEGISAEDAYRQLLKSAGRPMA